MTTSNSPVRTPADQTTRLVLAPPARNRPLDGGWWPRSRDLAVELAQLVAGLGAEVGRPVRAVYSPPDWDTPPRRVPLARGYLKVGCFPRDDTHVLDLRMLDGTTLRLLVVPPATDPHRAGTALDVAAEPEGTRTAGSILAQLAQPARDPGAEPFPRSDEWDDAPTDPEEHWTDDGGAWWDPHPVSPSYRPEQ